MPTPTRAALYHRVSSLDQDPELARDELRAAAARLGFTIALEEQETGSGANNDRPGLQRVMEAARRGKIDAVIVWKLDRFGRSALDLLANIQHLEDAGVRFIAISQGLDIKNGDAMSKLLLTMLAAVAEFERDLIRDRTRLGLARARDRGARLGRPAATFDIQKATRLRAGGMSYRAVALEVGVSVATVHSVLRAVVGGQ